MLSQKALTDYVFVDGLGVGDISNVVLRDRQMLAEDGMVVVIVNVNRHTGGIIGEPDIMSRGFVHIKTSKALIEETRKKVKSFFRDNRAHAEANDTYIGNKIRDQIGQFLFNKTNRRPMILPVVIDV